MAPEEHDHDDRPEGPEDIDARFEEIVAGLRAEQAASQQRRREAIRRAQSQRRPQGGATANRPLEGFDNPNPWPPRPRPVPDAETPGPEAQGPEAQGPEDPVGTSPGEGASAPSGGAEESDHSESAPGSWRGWEEPDEEEHFIPPTPPLPAGDLHLWAIVVGLLGGPLVLILSNAFTVLRGSWWTPLGIGLAVAGVVLLIMRLPRNRDYTDSSGGAQV